MRPAGPEPPFIIWAIVGIAQAAMCQMWLTGVLGAVFAFLAKSEWDKGDAASALNKLKVAKISTIVGFCLLGLGILVYVAFFVFVGLGAAAGGGY